MKVNVFVLFLIVLSTLWGCQDSKEIIVGDNRRDKLYDQLHGRYKLISSYSSISLDVDQDGVSSNNLVSEILGLVDSKVEIRVLSSSENSVYDAMFCLFWPEQEIDLNFRTQDPLAFDSDARVVYLLQGVHRYAGIKEHDNIIKVTGENSGEASARRWTIPREVVVERPNRLKITIEKLLYTKSGWEKVVITTVYERFTNVL